MERKAIYTREDEVTLIENGVDWNFHDEQTREHLHSLHPYPAKFIPQIPRLGLNRWSNIGDTVYDPFCGCGTTLLEAMLLGRNSIGTDNNSVALLASKAKTAEYDQNDLNKIVQFAKEVELNLQTAPECRHLIPDNKNFLYWFAPEILDRLAALKGLILKFEDPIRTLFLAAFSSIIVSVSLQDSDTRYARVKRSVEPESVGKKFSSKLFDILDGFAKISRLRRASVTLKECDARNVSFIKNGSVDLIVTSPPYLNAYDYHKYHRQRIHWIDGSVEFARDIEIGSHDEFTKKNATPDGYFTDMDACFSEWARVLKSNGRCLVVIGDAIVNKKAVCVADTFVDLLKNHGLRSEDRWIRTLHATKRAFNVRNSRISHEHVLLFCKS